MLILASVWLDEACSIEQVLGTSILVLGVLVAKVPVLDNVCMYDRMLEASARQAQPQTIIFRVQPRRLPTSPKLKTKQFAFGKLPKNDLVLEAPPPRTCFPLEVSPIFEGRESAPTQQTPLKAAKRGQGDVMRGCHKVKPVRAHATHRLFVNKEIRHSVI